VAFPFGPVKAAEERQTVAPPPVKNATYARSRWPGQAPNSFADPRTGFEGLYPRGFGAVFGDVRYPSQCP